MTEVIEEEDFQIPVNIITGFLGSGKTTLLNKWVNTEEFKDTLVLINEFGDVGLDHELVQAVDDTVVLLGSGCICCSLQGELIDSLTTNFIRAKKGLIPNFKRVLIETTGLADPSGVISTLAGDEFVMTYYRYDGTVTVLDGQFVREQLKNQYEAVKQIALADSPRIRADAGKRRAGRSPGYAGSCCGHYFFFRKGSHNYFSCNAKTALRASSRSSK